MATQIPTTYVTKYRANMDFALQQHKPKLATADKCMMEQGSGEKYLLRGIVGNDDMIERTSRNPDTHYTDSEHDRVWVTMPHPGEYAKLTDAMDRLASGIELAGKYVVGGRNAHNRWWDGTFLRGLFGTMLMGKEGTTVVPFPAGNVVDAAVRADGSGDTGMNVKKLMRARTLLAEKYVDIDDKLFAALSAAQIEDLYGEIQVVHADYAGMGGGPRMSSDGKRLIGLLGFEFVELELSNPRLRNAAELTLNGEGQRKNPFWVKSGMAMVVWEKSFSDLTVLPTKSYAKQVFHRTVVTATRTENDAVGYIENVEA